MYLTTSILFELCKAAWPAVNIAGHDLSCTAIPEYESQIWITNHSYRHASKNKDFKQRQSYRVPRRRRERDKIREKPKGLLRMRGGKQVDVPRSGPTWVKLISRCLKTWVFAFVSSAVSTLNNPCYKFRGTLMLVFSCCVRYFILKRRREIWSELKPVGEHVSTVKYLFESLCK